MPSKRPVTDDAAANGPGASEGAAGPSTSGIGEYDLPKTTVTKIAKGAFDDPTIKIQQDVFLALQKSATVYINYIASAAQEHSDSANRKTMNQQDVILATTEHLSGIGGDMNAANELRQILEEELAAFRANQATIKAAKAQGAPTSAGGPKRGFPGKGKNAASAVESETLENGNAAMASDATANDTTGQAGVQNALDDGDDAEEDEEDEVDEDPEHAEDPDLEEDEEEEAAAHALGDDVVPASEDEPRGGDDDTEMS